MAMLISVTNSQGTRRCDSRCYNAEHGNCKCICGGANHGVGLKNALGNCPKIAAAWCKESGIETVKLFGRVKNVRDPIKPESKQLTLF